jgi:hypothetical protein
LYSAVFLLSAAELIENDTHVEQRGAGGAGADEAITHMSVFSAAQASIACHSPRVRRLVVQPICKDKKITLSPP